LKVVPTAIPDVLVVEPAVFRDGRGHFLETWHAERYRAAGIPDAFVQDNRSRSVRGTLRGLHAQRSKPQGKLVQVVAGEVFDVAVDLRRGSPTYGRWVGVTLSADSFRQMWVPAGFAHGFCVTSDTADVEYKCTAPYDAADELRIAWDDPDLAITWPVASPALSPKDAAAPRLSALGFPPPRL
jgi:dTDP-4-dehydrorhamnose 3,5-epimerase